MFHFIALGASEPLNLADGIQVPGGIRQYMRQHQLEAIRFLFNNLRNKEFCIYNDDSGLGKCAATSVFLGAVAKSKRCLIVVQNDDKFVTGWQFHLDVLTELSVATFEANKRSIDELPEITIVKWTTILSIDDINKYNFDIIVIDNRGQMLSDKFCMSMLLYSLERKVNLLISSVDVTSDLMLLHNILRLGGCLQQQYEQLEAFEATFDFPDLEDMLDGNIDMGEYFTRREMLSNYCKEFCLRRCFYQYKIKLPFVGVDQHKISLDRWLSKNQQIAGISTSLDGDSLQPYHNRRNLAFKLKQTHKPRPLLDINSIIAIDRQNGFRSLNILENIFEPRNRSIDINANFPTVTPKTNKAISTNVDKEIIKSRKGRNVSINNKFKQLN